ncbi:MAG: GntR family transcriptional regulator [Lachnospiraceae bacterium]|nr:GntR family transcriptional regulator [Lachnospiraceae bacterium]
MAWELDSDRPIYTQLVERIQVQIISGYYPPGGKLPSVRDLAAVAAVNPNTMQKAFAELEREGLIVTQRTNGRTVTEDETLLKGIRMQMAREKVDVFVQTLKELGFSQQEILSLIQDVIEGEGKNE